MPDEDRRLAALHAYQILDTEPEFEFDDLTALAAEICQTPMAMISLLDGTKQWFKSRVGTDVLETPQSVSFCQYVVSSGELVLIPDATQDGRMVGSPLVTEEGKRFYAGAPLTTEEGEVVGALCVVDTAPRVLTPFQLRALETLSRQVIAQMELRKNLLEQRQTAGKLREQAALLDRARDAILVRDLNHHIIYWNQGAQNLYGWTSEEVEGKSIAELLYRDTSSFQAATSATLRDGEWMGEIEHTAKDGRVLTVSGRWSLMRDALGNPTSILAINSDITEKKKAEVLELEHQGLVRMASRLSKVGAWSVDVARMDVKWSDEACAILDLVPDEVDPQTYITRYFEGEARETLLKAFDDGVKFGTPYDLELPFVTHLGRHGWLRVVGEAVRDDQGGIVCVRGAIQDVTDRREAETSLATSHERFRQLAESMPMIVWTARPEGVLDFANHHLWDYTGLPPNTPQEGLFPSILHSDDFERVDAAWFESMESGKPFEIEYRLKRHDGEYRWFRVQIQAARDDQGLIVNWYGTAIDIHETKKLQEESTLLAERLTTTMESITDGFLTMDLEWRFTYANEAAVNLLMTPREVLLGEVAWELFPDAVGSSFDLNYRKALDENRDIEFEEFYAPIDRWLEVHAYPSAEGVAVHFRDISDRKRASRQLIEQSALLSNAQRIGRMGSWDFEIATSKLIWSDATCDLFGMDPNEFDGTLDQFFSLVVPEDRQKLANALDPAAMTGDSIHNEYRIQRADGEIRWMYERGTIERDASDNPIRRFGMVTDITERHQAALSLRKANEDLEARVELRTAELERTNQELRQAKVVAESANLAKSEFLSRMSHELRTPMNAILGFGQLLEMSELSDDSKDSLSYILKAGRHLLVLINDVLAITQVEIGETGVSLEPVSVAELLRECHALMRTIAGDHRVIIELQPFTETYVQADRHKLRQAFLNLISNGIKYNKKGGVLTIRVERVSNHEVAIHFMDTGVGISESNLTKLFTPFERLDAAGHIEGTGLGLALSKSLVEAMEGTLTVTSEREKGSCFTVQLHESTEAADAMPAEMPSFKLNIQSQGRATILVIEDNMTNVGLLERIFAVHEEWEMIVAMQGRMGLALAKEHHPDMILLDLHLPDISGKEVLAALKLDPELAGIPVVMISADALSKRSEELVEAGAFRYMTKPFDLPELFLAVDEALQSRSSS
jgi:PAS domain S-box-containing protein